MTRQCLKSYPSTPWRMSFPYQILTWVTPGLWPLWTLDLRVKIRGERWPGVFIKESALRTNYTTKGQAIKCYEATSKPFKHTLLFNQQNMIGSEGRRSELPGRRATSVAGGPQIEHVLIAQAQNTMGVYVTSRTRCWVGVDVTFILICLPDWDWGPGSSEG